MKRGTFDFPGLCPGPGYALTFSQSGYVRDRVEGLVVREDETTEVVRELDRTSHTGGAGVVRVNGTLATEGAVALAPIGASVPVRLRRGCTSLIRGDGSYSCQGLEPGPHRLIVEACAPGGDAIRESTVTVRAGQTDIVNLDVASREQ